MNTEARQRLRQITDELMASYSDAPPWEHIARLLAEALDLATADGVSPTDVGLASLAASGLFTRADLAPGRPAAQAEPQDAGVAAVNETWRQIRRGQ